MEKFLKDIKGMEVVDTKKLEVGFALMFDDGDILIVGDDSSTTFVQGPGWKILWEELLES